MELSSLFSVTCFGEWQYTFLSCNAHYSYDEVDLQILVPLDYFELTNVFWKGRCFQRFVTIQNRVPCNVVFASSFELC